MVLLAAFKALLYRYTEQGDIVVGTPVAGRQVEEVKDLIGFFVNTLALRTRLSGDDSFAELVRRVRTTCLGGYAHMEVPFEKLVEELSPSRDAGLTPLFQVMLVLQNIPAIELELPGLKLTGEAVENLNAKFDVTMVLVERDGGFAGQIEYRAEMFEQETIERLAGHFQRLLEEVTEDSEVLIGNIRLLTEEEEQLLRGWNPPAPARLGASASVGRRFSELARSAPHAPALVSPSGATMTYAELEERSDRLARLLRARGLRPEGVVAVLLPRSPELAVALLAVLKAGGAYLPLEAQSPAARQARLLRQAGARLLLTADEAAARLFGPLGWRGEVLAWPRLAARLAGGLGAPAPPAAVDPRQVAYVIYTSGSTGEPKGVEVTHANILARVCGADYAELGAGARVLQLAPLAFDASTFELWGPLLNGGAVVQAEEGVARAAQLRHWIRGERVTTLWLTSSLMNSLVDEDAGAFAGLRELLSGGEALSVTHVRRLLSQATGVRVTNGYGPTETTTFAMTYEVREVGETSRSIPLGGPISNTQIYILDESRQPVPMGVSGEIYIGGAGVAQGYMNRPGLTAASFQPDPFGREAGGRLYRTGDLGRRLAGGEVEFLGRNDAQVKIRGFRIELGEIEARLGEHPGVSEAVVQAYEAGEACKRLVAYYAGEEVGVEGLRSYLMAKLPEYMVPAAYVRLERLPLTANGKVDRQGLPAPAGAAYGQRRYEAPVGETEAVVASIWAEVLKVERVGRHDNFFELGGHSLLATSVVNRIRAALGKEFSVRTLFEASTVSEIAERLNNARTARVPLRPVIAPDRFTQRTKPIG
jgi:amino acid adenylation domain-containing protein